MILQMSIAIHFKSKEEFQDTKGVIRIRKSEKNRQHKRTNNDLQNIHIKLKIE